MSNQHLSQEPHDIKSNGEAWWYEVGAGIKVYFERHSGNEDEPTITGIIPWRLIRNALKRKDKP